MFVWINWQLYYFDIVFCPEYILPEIDTTPSHFWLLCFPIFLLLTSLCVYIHSVFQIENIWYIWVLKSFLKTDFFFIESDRFSHFANIRLYTLWDFDIVPFKHFILYFFYLCIYSTFLFPSFVDLLNCHWDFKCRVSVLSHVSVWVLPMSAGALGGHKRASDLWDIGGCEKPHVSAWVLGGRWIWPFQFHLDALLPFWFVSFL